MATLMSNTHPDKDRLDYFLEAYKEAAETYEHLNTKGNVLLSLQVAMVGALLINGNIALLLACGSEFNFYLLAGAIVLLIVALSFSLKSFDIRRYAILISNSKRIVAEELLLLDKEFYRGRICETAEATDLNVQHNKARAKWLRRSIFLFAAGGGVVCVFLLFAFQPFAGPSGATHSQECWPSERNRF